MSKSILQGECNTCYICGRWGTEEHHLYFGNPDRQNSEKYGLKIRLCPEHHRGDSGVHQNRDLDLRLKQIGQQAFEEKHSREEFMAIFGRNYL